MKIQEASEDYMEKILMLQEKQGDVHAIDIVNYMNLSKPTVSVALKKLKENGYVTIDENRHLGLTEKGMEIAKKTYEKHNFIAKLLIKLGVSSEQAYEDSCHIEHVLSDESFEAIKKHVKESDL